MSTKSNDAMVSERKKERKNDDGLSNVSDNGYEYY